MLLVAQYAPGQGMIHPRVAHAVAAAIAPLPVAATVVHVAPRRVVAAAKIDHPVLVVAMAAVGVAAVVTLQARIPVGDVATVVGVVVPAPGMIVVNELPVRVVAPWGMAVRSRPR